jgi:hypothetical protein
MKRETTPFRTMEYDDEEASQPLGGDILASRTNFQIALQSESRPCLAPFGDEDEKSVGGASSTPDPPQCETRPTLALLAPYTDDAVEPKDLGESLLGGDMMISLFDCFVATEDCILVTVKPSVFGQRDYDDCVLERQKTAKSKADAARNCVESIHEHKTKKQRGDTWTCHACGAKNPDDESQCLQCHVHRAPQMKAEGWGDLFAGQNQGKWKCVACSVWTPNDEWKCAACETARPGASSNRAGTAVTISASGFSLGLSSSSVGTNNSSSQPFQFSASSTSHESSKAATSFAFGSQPPLSSTSAPATGGFTFGAPTSTSVHSFGLS